MNTTHYRMSHPWIYPLCLMQLFISLVCLVGLTSAVEPPTVESARELASAAYYQLDGNRFDQTQQAEALAKLKRATILNPNEPFVYLSASMMVLIQGFQRGEWYETRTFVPGTVEQALLHAEKAAQLAPTLSQAHAQLARLYITLKNYSQAQASIVKAKTLDPNSFYPWYFEGIYYEKLGIIDSARTAFDAAEARATEAHQKSSVDRHRAHVAAKAHDPMGQEQLLLKNIAANLTDGRIHSEYAVFLMCKGRYEDALVQWERTLNLMPSWPYAEEQLAKTRRMVAVEREKRTSC